MERKDIFEMMELELKLIDKDIKLNSEYLRERYENGRMSLSSLNIEYLPMASLITLNPEILNLGSNKLSELPENFGELTNLKSLSLVQNDLSELPTNFHKLINLETLYLSKNQFTTVPSSLKLMKNLKNIHIVNNNIPIFDFNFPKSLKVLNASQCNISIIKLMSYQLANIESINLSYNGITTLPQLENKVSIKYIFLNNNKLEEFPSSWYSNTIKLLHLTSNNIEQFDFNGLDGIEELQLAGNKIIKLVGKPDMYNIRLISLDGNPIEELPDLNGVFNIETLSLSNTLITKLPNSFANLRRLEYLDLSDIRGLKMIPDFFINFKKLKRLSIRRSKGYYGRLCIPIKVINNIREIQCIIEGHHDSIHVYVSNSCGDGLEERLTKAFLEFKQKLSKSLRSMRGS